MSFAITQPISEIDITDSSGTTKYLKLTDSAAKQYARMYGECTTAAGTADKDVAIDASLSTGFISSYGISLGQRIAVKFVNGNAAGTAMTICMGITSSSTYRKAVYYNGSQYDGVLEANGIYEFVYDGTYWQILNPPSAGNQVVVGTTTPTSSDVLIWVNA